MWWPKVTKVVTKDRACPALHCAPPPYYIRFFNILFISIVFFSILFFIIMIIIVVMVKDNTSLIQIELPWSLSLAAGHLQFDNSKNPLVKLEMSNGHLVKHILLAGAILQFG